MSAERESLSFRDWLDSVAGPVREYLISQGVAVERIDAVLGGREKVEAALPAGDDPRVPLAALVLETLAGARERVPREFGGDGATAFRWGFFGGQAATLFRYPAIAAAEETRRQSKGGSSPKGPRPPMRAVVALCAQGIRDLEGMNSWLALGNGMRAVDGVTVRQDPHGYAFSLDGRPPNLIDDDTVRRYFRFATRGR